MTIGEIIFAVLIAIQGVLFLIGAMLMIAYIKKHETKKSDKLCLTASILWAISPLFSMIGVFFGYFL